MHTISICILLQSNSAIDKGGVILATSPPGDISLVSSPLPSFGSMFDHKNHSTSHTLTLDGKERDISDISEISPGKGRDQCDAPTRLPYRYIPAA